MPGRTAAQAREAFLAPLQRSLSCISQAQLWVPASKRPGEDEAILLSKDPLPLNSARIGGVRLVLGHQFKVVKDAPKRWHVSTVSYRYHLLDPSGREMLAWHWHPGTGTDHPHIHVSPGLIGRRMHIPTGRVSIEAVLWFLLGDLQVKPTRDHKSDWTEILAGAERPFIRHRRWHARGPDDELATARHPASAHKLGARRDGGTIQASTEGQPSTGRPQAMTVRSVTTPRPSNHPDTVSSQVITDRIGR